MPAKFFDAVIHLAAQSPLSLRQLGAGASIPWTVLRDWMRGSEPASFSTIERLAESLGYDIVLVPRVTPATAKDEPRSGEKSA